MRPYEDLDEQIDRVASTLTFVSADPALAARIAAQLGDGRQVWWPKLAFAGASLATLAIVMVVMNREPIPPPAAVIATSTPARAVVASPSAVTTTARPSVAPTRNVALVRQVPELPALPAPVALDVDALDTAPLSLEPVAVAPLDVAPLQENK